MLIARQAAEHVSVTSQLSFLAAKDPGVAQVLAILGHVEPVCRSRKSTPSSCSVSCTTAPESSCQRCSGVQEGSDLEPDGPTSFSEHSKTSQHVKLEKPPLVSHLADMLQTLSSLVLPLLPQLWQYFPSREHVQISSERTARIVSVNSYGQAEDVKFLKQPEATENLKDIGHAPAVLVDTMAISAGQ